MRWRHTLYGACQRRRARLSCLCALHPGGQRAHLPERAPSRLPAAPAEAATATAEGSGKREPALRPRPGARPPAWVWPGGGRAAACSLQA
eukprot:364536-Chlamydomonas_euryale.AAC.1